MMIGMAGMCGFEWVGLKECLGALTYDIFRQEVSICKMALHLNANKIASFAFLSKMASI